VRATLLLASGVAVALASIAGAATPAAAAPKCFGAAARDAAHPCSNPTRSVYPKLADVDRASGPACRLTSEKPQPVCTFGASAAKARGHVALIGDSHALQWRPAVDAVAKAERWRAYSVTAPGCFFSDAVDDLAEGIRAPCQAWYRSALRWIARHPEVSTVFVSQNADTPVVVPPGTTALAIKVAGFRRAWAALPKTVKHVVVIRDTPATSDATVACVRGAIATRTQRPGTACPLARSVAVRDDTAVAATKTLRFKRYQSVDLTSFFCGPRSCYPVIGGVLVYRDVFGHINVAYARTLAPYLLRKVRGLMASW
jgi:hypothetical protein